MSTTVVEVTDFTVTVDRAPVPRVEVAEFTVSVSSEISDQDQLHNEAAE